MTDRQKQKIATQFQNRVLNTKLKHEIQMEKSIKNNYSYFNLVTNIQHKKE